MKLGSHLQCPYFELPDTSRWDRAMARLPVATINPHTPSSLRITPETRVASGGSCFAQNITTALRARGYNYLLTEQAPTFFSPELAAEHNYGIFSARYGNIYTPLQLLQLLQRAFDDKTPAEQIWTDGKGRFFDLLRPRVTPSGFSSLIEAQSDIRQHLSAVRRLFKEVEVFVFTLGLTEGWLSTTDGTIYPTCPGCGNAGVYDATKYYFHNFEVTETTDHLLRSIRRLKEINSAARILLTVSPVPLIATMESRHVLQATTYSKSVLRVAAEKAIREFDHVDYFASYEIITGTSNTQQYFSSDRRTVTQAGIDHVMKVFFEMYTDSPGPPRAQASISDESQICPEDAAPGVVCDEEDFFRALAASQDIHRLGGN
jgi:hypothetical protein